MATKKAKGPTKSAKKAAAKRPAKKAKPAAKKAKPAAKKAKPAAKKAKPAAKKAKPATKKVKPAAKKATSATKKVKPAAADKAKPTAEKVGPGKPVRKAAAKDRTATGSPSSERREKKRKGPPVSETKEYRPSAQIGPDGVLILSGDKALLRAYYGGQQMPSPMPEGFLMLLGVQRAPDGGGAVLFECSASSLRCQLSIPKATTKERRMVKAVQEAGDDPNCPRHGPDERLVRAGKNLTCRLCGISYGKV
jgi:hypothetical protein